LLGGATTATDGLGDTMTWTYNADAAVTTVQASFSTQPMMSGIVYGPFGMTNVALGNGHKEVDGYDARGRLKNIAYNNASNQAVYSVALNRAGDSSLTSSTDSVNGSWTYGYDAFNRLTSATASSGTYSGATLHWTYDRYGNRLTQSASGSNSGSVFQESYSFASHQVAGFCYDSAGNLLDEVACASAGSNHLYKYDAEGRLIATAGMTYEYDASGTRRSKDNSAGTPTTSYLHDGDGNQIAELNASRVVQHVNVYSGKHLIGTWNPATSKVYYAYSDWLGTKRYEADNTGTYLNSWTNLPFGDNQTALGTGVDATEHHFTGKEHDNESGLDYFKARYYQSQTGRWLLPDWSDTPVPVPYATFSNPQSLNLYTYVGNNPVNEVDADGHVNQGGNLKVGLQVTDPIGGCGVGSLNDPGLSVCEWIMDGAIDPGSQQAIALITGQTADAAQWQAAADKIRLIHDPNDPDYSVTVNANTGGCSMDDPICQYEYQYYLNYYSQYRQVIPLQTRSHYPDYKGFFCLGYGLKNSWGSMAIDSIGLIPEGGGAGTVARKIGNFVGYRGKVADNFGKAAIKQFSGANNTYGATQGAAKGDLTGTGLAVAGFIPGLGQIAAVGAMANDWNTGMEESPECH